MEIRYFDNAATTKVKDEVLKEMLPYLCLEYGNPSSLYSLGRSAKRAIENAREKVARLINCKAKEIYFTGSGSESDNTALRGIAYNLKEKGNHIITSKIEHPAVINTCKALEKEGFVVSYINVDEKGFLDLEELKSSINNKTILISIMFANNEIGTIQEIDKIAKIAKEKNIIFHTDAVQAVGNIKIDVEKIEIDMLSLSGHKIGAPKGIGALYVKDNIKFEKFINGGHQEKDKRAGTENVSGIVALGKACEIANKNLNNHIEKLTKNRDKIISQIEEKLENVKLNGAKDNRLPGNINFSFKNVDGNELLFKLDEKGICASAGSACSSGNANPSHVLVAIKTEKEYLNSSLRITLGDETTNEDVDYLIENLVNIINQIQERK